MRLVGSVQCARVVACLTDPVLRASPTLGDDTVGRSVVAMLLVHSLSRLQQASAAEFATIIGSQLEGMLWSCGGTLAETNYFPTVSVRVVSVVPRFTSWLARVVRQAASLVPSVFASYANSMLPGFSTHLTTLASRKTTPQASQAYLKLIQRSQDPCALLLDNPGVVGGLVQGLGEASSDTDAVLSAIDALDMPMELRRLFLQQGLTKSVSLLVPNPNPDTRAVGASGAAPPTCVGLTIVRGCLAAWQGNTNHWGTERACTELAGRALTTWFNVVPADAMFVGEGGQRGHLDELLSLFKDDTPSCVAVLMALRVRGTDVRCATELALLWLCVPHVG